MNHKTNSIDIIGPTLSTFEESFLTLGLFSCATFPMQSISVAASGHFLLKWLRIY